MSENITETATSLTTQGASRQTVNTAVSGITSGMGKVGTNTANSMIKAEAGVAAVSETGIKIGEDKWKNRY